MKVCVKSDPPMRMCTGCGEMKPKKDLVRVVKAPDAKDENGQVLAAGGVSLDLTGRKPGRGAYVCRKRRLPEGGAQGPAV